MTCFYCANAIKDSEDYAVLLNEKPAHLKCMNKATRELEKRSGPITPSR